MSVSRSVRYRGYVVVIQIYNDSTSVQYAPSTRTYDTTGQGTIKNDSPNYEDELAGLIAGAKQNIDAIHTKRQNDQDRLERAIKLAERVVQGEADPDPGPPTHTDDPAEGFETKRSFIGRLFLREK